MQEVNEEERNEHAGEWNMIRKRFVRTKDECEPKWKGLEKNED